MLLSMIEWKDGTEVHGYKHGLEKKQIRNCDVENEWI
jgi:hypothetical protein